MAALTFVDTHNMVAYLSKSDVSTGFDQIVDFLIAHAIQYALVVNPTIYVSCIKQFWPLATIKKVNDMVQLRALIDRKKVVVTEDVIRQDLHLDDADGDAEEDVKVEVITTPAPPSLITALSPPPQAQPATPHDTPLQEQLTVTSDSFNILLNTLMETCATLSQRVVDLEQDKNTQALEILKLNKRVKKLEKKKSRFSGLKRLRKGGKIKAIDADVDITLVDVET
nr:xylulose kinase-1 [Tanacetum cinerariifolium]